MIRAWMVAALTLAFAASPILTRGFAGFDKDQFPIPLEHWPAQPAGWAFSIWGVIYLWLIASGVKGLKENGALWRAMRPALSVSLAVGVFWISVANTAPIAATVMIVVMAATAIAALLRTRGADPGWLAGPVGLYAGWLTAASGVACAVVLSGYGLLSPRIAAVVLLSLVLIVALIVTGRARTHSYPIAVCWALSGVIAANASAAHWPVAALAGVGIVLIATRALLQRPLR